VQFGSFVRRDSVGGRIPGEIVNIAFAIFEKSRLML